MVGQIEGGAGDLEEDLADHNLQGHRAVQRSGGRRQKFHAVISHSRRLRQDLRKIRNRIVIKCLCVQPGGKKNIYYPITTYSNPPNTYYTIYQCAIFLLVT